MLFGVLSLMFSSVGLAMGQPPGVGLIVGIGLVAVAANEYRGAVLLGRLHHGAPIRLALGQVVLGSMIIGYCLWAIIHTETSAALSDPQLQEILADYEGLLKGMTALVYGAVMAATVLFQGLAALYYLTRGKQILNYVSQTPNWIVEIDRLRAGG